MLLLYYRIHVICMYNTCILVLSPFTSKGLTPAGRESTLLQAPMGVFKVHQPMVNTLIMKILPFASVSDDKC